MKYLRTRIGTFSIGYNKVMRHMTTVAFYLDVTPGDFALELTLNVFGFMLNLDFHNAKAL